MFSGQNRYMRKVVGAAALLLLAVFLVLLIPFPGSQPLEAEGIGEIAPSQMLLSSAEIADDGGGKAAVLRLSLFSDAPRNVTAFCLPSSLQKNVLILSFPSVPGTDRGLPSKIAASLSQSGISSRTVGVDDAITSENTLIISPSGAIPLPLLENAPALQTVNSRVVVLVLLKGKSIDADGNIAQLNESLPPVFEAVALMPSGESKAVSEATRLAIIPSQASLVHAASTGNFTLAVPISSSSAHCRAILDMGNGKSRFVDSGMLEAQKGILAGPAQLAAGEKGVFEFSLSGKSEVGRTLRFFAVAYSPSGEEHRREIAGGEIKEGWASKFSLGFSQGGKYVVRIIDQFGRKHAAAYVQVPLLEVLPVAAEGNRYEFLVLLDSGPANGALSARLDNGTQKNYSVQEGKLVIWAAPSSGDHAIYFDFSGSSAAYLFTAQQSGMAALLDTYIRFGVPAAIFVLAVFLLLRAGRRSKYSITFPEAALFEPGIVDASESDILAAYRHADRKFGGFFLPCYPHEIASELSRVKLGRQGREISPHSVLCILRKLCSQGAFAEHESAFVPVSEMGGFSAKELSILRTIHESMLERGLRFSKKPVITVRRNELELAIFRGKGSVLAGIGKPCRAVVFGASEEIAKFQKELSVPGAESSRIRLALANDKVIFVPATRAGLLGILP